MEKRSFQNGYYTATQPYEGVWQIDESGTVFLYLILGRTSALLIDTGYGVGDVPAVLRELTDLPVTLVNTHAHFDHCGGNYQFDRAFIHQADVPLIPLYNDGDPTGRRRALMEENAKTIAYPEGFSLEALLQTRPCPAAGIQEGYVFSLGGRDLEVISTPGHTPGCICLLDRQNGLLFAGDTLGMSPSWLFLPYCLPVAAYREGLVHLRSFMPHVRVFLPSHDGILQDLHVLDDLIACADEILAGTDRSEPFSSSAGSGCLARHGSAGIVYDRARIR